MKPEFGKSSDEAPSALQADGMVHNPLLAEYLKSQPGKSDLRVASLSQQKPTPGSPEHFHMLEHSLMRLQRSISARQQSATKHGESQPISLPEFADRSLQLFDRLDLDKNGKLSKRELGIAVQRAHLTGGDAQALAALYTNIAQPGEQNFKAWKLGSGDGIAHDDLVELRNKLQFGGVVHDDLKHGLMDTMQSVADSQSVASRRLFANVENPIASINPLAIHQGSVNDCYFEAALSSLAATNPKAIKDMIQPLANGRYMVTFPGDASHPVIVSRPTDAEAGLYNHASKFGTWARLMEKAYGEYIRAHNSNDPIALTPQDSLNIGKEQSAMKLLTGDDAGAFPSKRNLYQVLSERNVDAKEIADRITNALSKHRLLAAATVKIDGKTSFNGYITDHAHAILGFDRTGADGGTLLIYNPLGKLTTLSLNKFMHTFSDITVSSKRPLLGPCQFDKIDVTCAG